ncbi:hypothetical protein [Flavobacterium taihuense]|uniref:Signal peptidase n=1 Tax=Flavobacterium taihuense TaxID=2857508 RepID=A0ABS6XR54_9FLAO|nr:hypothetical protein [Flavobacterium taihuense]MBW4359155.1 hypothetical protein [Flavobacterium taihuense]
MKINSNKSVFKIILLLFCVFGPVVCAQAQGGPGNPGNPGGPPEYPINENLILLFPVGTLFGFYIIYKHSQNKKRPILK